MNKKSDNNISLKKKRYVCIYNKPNKVIILNVIILNIYFMFLLCSVQNNSGTQENQAFFQDLKSGWPNFSMGLKTPPALELQRACLPGKFVLGVFFIIFRTAKQQQHRCEKIFPINGHECLTTHLGKTLNEALY